MCRISLLAVASGLIAFAPATAESRQDVCVAVEGLCAADHRPTFDELRSAVSPNQRAQMEATSRFLTFATEAWAAEFDPALRDTANSAADAIGAGLGSIKPGVEPKAVDPGIFGPRGGGADEPLPGAGLVPGRNRIGGSTGGISDALRSSGMSRPGSGGLLSQGGDLPGSSQAPTKDVSGPSSPNMPNSYGGYTRMTSESGYVKVVETRSHSDGGSSVIVTTVAPDGTSDVDITRVGELARPGQQTEMIYHSHREGPIGFFEYRMARSSDGGRTWETRTTGRDVVPIPARLVRNIDPDSLVGRSAYPPACAIANPDCARPLLLRYHRARPGTYGRPDDTAGGSPAPRLRPNTYGNLVNPGIEPVAGGSLGTSGPSARAIDGGKLTNPADQRGGSGTGSGTGSGSGTGPKP